MSASRISKVPLPESLAGDSDFIILQPMLVNGVSLSHGDHLPDDSPLRGNPKRLETLCRLRKMAPCSVKPAKVSVSVPVERTEEKVMAAAVSSPAPVDAPVRARKVKFAASDIKSFSVADLKAHCREMGLPTYGTTLQLRKRLRTSLG